MRIIILVGFVFLTQFTSLSWAKGQKGLGSAYDVSFINNPVYEGVERVYIHISYGGLTQEEQNIYDPLLQKTNFKEALTHQIQDMFAPEWCKRMEGESHTCKNQPVILVEKLEELDDLFIKQKQKSVEEEAGDDGVLILLYNAYIWYLQREGPLEPPVLIVQKQAIRPHKDLSFYFRKPRVKMILVNESHAVLETFIESIGNTY